jgi:hypothetical protein
MAHRVSFFKARTPREVDEALERGEDINGKDENENENTPLIKSIRRNRQNLALYLIIPRNDSNRDQSWLILIFKVIQGVSVIFR